jgi:hypothetical protein
MATTFGHFAISATCHSDISAILALPPFRHLAVLPFRHFAISPFQLRHFANFAISPLFNFAICLRQPRL